MAMTYLKLFLPENKNYNNFNFKIEFKRLSHKQVNSQHAYYVLSLNYEEKCPFIYYVSFHFFLLYFYIVKIINFYCFYPHLCAHKR